MKEFLEVVFSTWSIPVLYEKDQRDKPVSCSWESSVSQMLRVSTEAKVSSLLEATT